MSIRKLMSSLRRSTRLAAKANSKTSVPKELPQLVADDSKTSVPKELPKLAPSTVTEQPNNFFILTGAGSSGKSLFHKALPLNKYWSLNYTLYPVETNMKDKDILHEAIAKHETLHEDDTWKALSSYQTVWEHELHVATRWLCIDNRILKESAEMRAKAETYANKVNDLLPALYAKINSLKKQLATTEGRNADGIHHELLMMQLLLTVADHVHEKWNIAMTEFEAEQACLRTTFNKVDNVFKPEMPFDSDDDW